MQKDGQSLLNSDVPMGLGMALAQNVEAMQAFSAMEPAKQRAIIDRTHTIGSKKEMQAFVSRLGQGASPQDLAP